MVILVGGGKSVENWPRKKASHASPRSPKGITPGCVGTREARDEGLLGQEMEVTEPREH